MKREYENEDEDEDELPNYYVIEHKEDVKSMIDKILKQNQLSVTLDAYDNDPNSLEGKELIVNAVRAIIENQSGTRVAELNLGYCDDKMIDDILEGGILSKNSTLLVLNIMNTKLTGKGIVAVIESGKNLKKLYLSTNFINEEDVELIAKAMEQNPYMTLNITGEKNSLMNDIKNCIEPKIITSGTGRQLEKEAEEASVIKIKKQKTETDWKHAKYISKSEEIEPKGEESEIDEPLEGVESAGETYETD